MHLGKAQRLPETANSRFKVGTVGAERAFVDSDIFLNFKAFLKPSRLD
jgi:hypothetical protein